ncbi:hypothetical protein [Fischerella muscicola]|uniref:hypothetical protein n=1 Tax=Fischerella muscicola TaxID=92938 RepID=UPI00031A4F26|nr:hypothetical protein [Fischerella muscicola]
MGKAGVPSGELGAPTPPREWGLGAKGQWGDGEMGRWGECLSTPPHREILHHQVNLYPNFCKIYF